MGRSTTTLCFALFLLLPLASLRAQDAPRRSPESRFISGARQLTFEGKRAGEGYFSADGASMVFQSEREIGNPFYQIYVMDLEMGDVERVSPGHGKTTCAWIHPEGRRVLFASTHGDPNSKKLQEEELAFRASGKKRRYSWDYDEHFDIWEYDRDAKSYRQITKARGYDAEGSYSPDGSYIIFSSNRHAYTEELSPEDRERLKVDKSLFLELYRINVDGTGLKRLTDCRGYDGGPFFDPKGEYVCWRRFSEDGLTAEVYTMRTDGSDQRRITRIGAMSWAPYFHPSGEYLIFTTNRHGFANFELYIVDRLGRGEPVRITYTPGFDGLPTFTPDGTQISWTTNRTPGGDSQIFIAQWNHEEAMKAIKAAREAGGGAAEPEAAVSVDSLPETSAKIAVEDLSKHIKRLCAEDMGGRLTGSAGEKLATAWVAANFKKLGLEAAAPGGGYIQRFHFTLPKERDLPERSFEGRNVVARLKAKTDRGLPAIVIGAHLDHLGNGEHHGGAHQGKVHPGADDNASGVAAMLEVAEYLAALQKKGRLGLERDVIFATWSGEELGLFGSKAYLAAVAKQLGNPEHLRDHFAAYLNLDMVGRLRKELILSGVGSSPDWTRVIERRNAPVGLAISIDPDCNLPTDATSFYLRGVPILSAFTGAHADYHKPTDTVEKLNYKGIARVARFMALVTRGLARNKTAPSYVKHELEKQKKARGEMQVWLGTIPNYAKAPIPGLLLDGVAEGGPAYKAGLRGEDIIVSLAGEKIADIHDYARVIEMLKVGVKVEVSVVRDGKTLTMDLVPGARK